jgi:hypothetical protein
VTNQAFERVDPDVVAAVSKLGECRGGERSLGEERLVEAIFDFDEGSRALTGVVVRAGELGGREDTTGAVRVGDLPPREMTRLFARRPENDGQWAIVICARRSRP